MEFSFNNFTALKDGTNENLKDLYRTEDLYTGYKELDDAR